TGQERKENTGAPSNLIQLCFRTSVVRVVVGNPGPYSRSKERDCPRPRPGSARPHYAPGRRIGVPYRPGVWRGNRAMPKSVGGQSAVLSSPILRVNGPSGRGEVRRSDFEREGLGSPVPS